MIIFIGGLVAACQLFGTETTVPSPKKNNIINEKTENLTFIGNYIAEEVGADGSTVLLKSADTGNMLYAVISPANLGPNSKFDYKTLEKGYMIKVTGEPFRLNNRTQMAAKTAVSYRPVKIAEKHATQREISTCHAANGKIIKAGKAQYDFCLQPLPDTKEYCSDESMCFGDCLLSSSADHAQPGDKVDGYCASDNHQFGCRALVNDGKYEGTLCVD